MEAPILFFYTNSCLRLDWITHFFQLEAMTFISGLLLGYQCMRKPGYMNFHSCVVKKVKRILLPCVIFGVAYYWMFDDMSASFLHMTYEVLNGCGHLWFLPMIFWCFVLTYLITLKIHHSKCKYVLIISLLFLLFNPLIILPFGLGILGRYYFFFYLGFCLKQGWISFPFMGRKNLMLALFLFLCFFTTWKLVRSYWTGDMRLDERMFRFVVSNFLKLVSVLSAVYFAYGVANKVRVTNYLASKPILITLSGYCYGVYIYQEFILRVLYYKTSLPVCINEYWLPWFASFITLILSILLCHITLRFKFGRFLIG